MRPMNILRDPAWQFIGIIIALVGLYLTAVTDSKSPDILDIITYSEQKLFYLPPSMDKKIRIELNNKKLDTQNLRHAYYLIQNTSQKSIKPTDFISSLSITSTENEIIAVDSVSDASSIAPEWSKSGNNTWQMKPALINKDAAFWVTVVFSPNTKEKDTAKEIKWRADIIDFKVTNHESVDKYLESSKWSRNFFSAHFSLDGSAVYLFFTAQLLLFIFLLLIVKNFGPREINPKLLACLITTLPLCTIIAEVSIDSIINKRPQAPIAIFAIGSLACIFLLLLIRSNKHPTQTDEPSLPLDDKIAKIHENA